ncbi:MAG: hypothetical protein Q9169_002706 [Polycauliona sp. 2 TL-2023]
MASVSPPKPWERASSAAASLSAPPTTSSASSPQITASSTPSTSTSTSQPPALPAKPSSLSSVVNNNASNYSPYGANRLGSSPYGVGGGYGSYSSPYSRLGGMNSMYGGYGGGYGSMYGGMGGMGGMNSMYGGGMGQPGMNPNDPNSLTNSFNQNTQATFQMIESIVGAFGGFAQMLESTYMATHSSFFGTDPPVQTMISVAEQFSNLRTTLGSVLGIYTLLRWARTLLAKLTGRPPPADATSLTPSAFAAFQGLSSHSSHHNNNNPNAPPTPSKKPFLVFILAVFGLPYLMSKLIRSLAASQQSQSQSQQQLALQQPQDNNNNKPTDPSQLLFCRLLYDYTPPNHASAAEGIDLSVKKGDLVAVLSQKDPMGNASEWWRCRTRDGKVGYLPGVYMEVIVREKSGVKAIEKVGDEVEMEGGRAKTMSDEGGSSRASSLKVPVGDGGKRGMGMGWGVEEFQKGAFYS